MNDTYSNPDKHVLLNNNIKMPILGLGTSHNGGYSHEAVVYALSDCGYRHIDTAKRYGCETFIAEAIQESSVDRSELFLATKCWPTDYGTEKTRAAVTGSCQRLKTDYLDLYFLHWPLVPSGCNRKELLMEAWRTLELMYDEGTLRAIGVSNYLEPDLEELLEECSVIPHVNQVEFHPFHNPVALRRLCEENKIQFEGFSPLAKGRILTNNRILEISHRLGRTPAQVLIRWNYEHGVPTIPKSTKTARLRENYRGYSPMARGEMFREPMVQAVAERNHRSLCQVLLRWNVQRQIPCIPKSTKKPNVKENSEIFDFKLSASDMAVLDDLPQCLSVMDRSTIQSRIDSPMPDGYKLGLCPNGQRDSTSKP